MAAHRRHGGVSIAAARSGVVFPATNPRRGTSFRDHNASRRPFEGDPAKRTGRGAGHRRGSQTRVAEPFRLGARREDGGSWGSGSRRPGSTRKSPAGFTRISIRACGWRGRDNGGPGFPSYGPSRPETRGHPGKKSENTRSIAGRARLPCIIHLPMCNDLAKRSHTVGFNVSSGILAACSASLIRTADNCRPVTINGAHPIVAHRRAVKSGCNVIAPPPWAKFARAPVSR